MRNAVRIISYAIIIALLMPLLAHADVDPAEIQEEILKTKSGESYTYICEVCGNNYIVFAQNSPDWGDITAGKKANTRTKDALCAIFSLSNIIVNSVSYEDLNKVRSLMINDPKIDTKTVAAHKGYKDKYKFIISSNEDYLRYFPLCISNLASGNARVSIGQIRSRGYYKKLFKTYNIEYTETEDLKECIELVKQGAMASVCTGGSLSPIAPKFGHYFVMIHADDNYVYFLDSLFRTEYQYDKKGIIEIVNPGVFRVKRENVKFLAISGSKFVVWPNKDKTHYTQEMYDNIVKISNESIEKKELK